MSVLAHGFSVQFGRGDLSDGTHLFATTYDGASGLPLLEDVGDFLIPSGEIKAVPFGASTFKMDYIHTSASGGILEYGVVKRYRYGCFRYSLF